MAERAEILKKILSFFGRNDDNINSFWNLLTFSVGLEENYDTSDKQCNPRLESLKVSQFRKQIFLFSFEPKTQQNIFLIPALASKKRSDQKNKGTLYH